MKKILALVLAMLSVLAFSGCGTNPADDGKLSIVTTAFPHYDFARQLTKGIDNVEIKMLVSPGSEVHTYDPSPSDILAISECDIFIYTGGESETWVTDIIKSSGNKNMRVISFMDICSPDGEHEEKHDEHEHEHVYDEHVWTLPIMSETICGEITKKLCDADSENADRYNENLKEYIMKLNELDAEFSGIFDEAKRNFVVFADRFPFYHLAAHYKLEYFSAFSGCSSSTEPSAVVIAELSSKVKSEKIPYVFTIEFSNKKIAKSVIEGSDAKILTLHSCHNVSKEDFENGITYYDLMMQNAANLRKALCE